MFETSLFSEVIPREKSGGLRRIKDASKENRTKICKRIGHLMGSIGLIPIRPSKEIWHEPQNCLHKEQISIGIHECHFQERY